MNPTVLSPGNSTSSNTGNPVVVLPPGIPCSEIIRLGYPYWVPPTLTQTPELPCEAMVTSGVPPTPPNWDKSCETALLSRKVMSKIPVLETSQEYKVLCDMAFTSPALNILRIERVVNSILWRKFTNYRKEMMTHKSSDFETLAALGLPDDEIQQLAYQFLNFERTEGMLPYSDNIALLFHGTRTRNLDDILTQGLDERMGRDTGVLMGRGIYFSDDPAKAMKYDVHGVLMVFAVYLGDCFTAAQSQHRKDLVREPAKASNQKRNPSDLFFDSIVARPDTTVNEFAIYNRNQCVPLYLIHYQKPPNGSPNVPTSLVSTTLAPPTHGMASSTSQSSVHTLTPLHGPYHGSTGYTPAPHVVTVSGPPTAFVPSASHQSGQPYVVTASQQSGQHSAFFVTLSHQSGLPAASVPVVVPSTSTAAVPPDSKIYVDARRRLPPFAWTPPNVKNPRLVLSPANANHWPFFAQTVFKRMSIEVGLDPVPVPPPIPIVPEDRQHHDPASKLKTLRLLGFENDETNTRVLKQFNGNLERAVDFLFENVQSGTDALPTSSANPVPTPAPMPSSNFIQPPPSSTRNRTGSVPKPKSTSFSSTSPPAKIPKRSDPIEPGSSRAVAAATAAMAVANADWKLVPLEPPASSSTISPGSNSWSITTIPSTSTDSNAQPGLKIRIKRLHEPGTSGASATVTSPTATSTEGSAQALEPEEDCQICYSEMIQPVVMDCSHKLCSECHKRIVSTGTTMSGTVHNFLKCPFCKARFGIEVGNCPDGRMATCIVPKSLEGYEDYTTISVAYYIPEPPYAVTRMAYFPNSPQGQHIVELLKTAWDRRLVFFIGTSMTTGRTNAIIWNIHHKTAMSGGVMAHAYPDPTFLDRIQVELKEYGIE